MHTEILMKSLIISRGRREDNIITLIVSERGVKVSRRVNKCFGEGVIDVLTRVYLVNIVRSKDF